MILDIIAYLKSDATLSSLLESTGSNSKIYPVQVPHQGNIPYIRYSISNDGTYEENLVELAITFDCISGSYLQVLNIKNRLVELLDRQDKIRNAISSSDYYMYWCKNVDGSDEKEPQQNYFHKAIIFQIKYAKK